MILWWCSNCEELSGPKGGPCHKCGTQKEYATFSPTNQSTSSGQRATGLLPDKEARIDTALLVASIRVCGALWDKPEPKEFHERWAKLRELAEEVFRREMERKDQGANRWSAFSDEELLGLLKCGFMGTLFVEANNEYESRLSRRHATGEGEI